MATLTSEKPAVRVFIENEWIDVTDFVEPFRMVGHSCALAGESIQLFGNSCEDIRVTFALFYEVKRLGRWHVIFTLLILLVALLQRI